MPYSILAYGNVVLLVILCLPYILRISNKKFFGNHKKITKLVRFLKSIHRSLGIILLILSLIHGYMMLGRFALHTGTILYLCMIVIAIFGMLFHLKKKKIWLQLHKGFVAIMILLLLIHIFMPSALYYLLN